MTGVLRSATTWIIAALLGISVYSVMVAQQLAVERDLAIERAERTLERNAQPRAVMEWQRDQLGMLHKAIKERDEQLAQNKQHIDDSREAAQALERDDDEIAEWAGRPVGGGIVDWLRDLRANADANSDGADSSDIPDKPAARTKPLD